MLVSIIIPCYNVENYVARAIDSALAQTYLHTEIICVDNNSTDGTLKILNDYRKKYPEKIQVFQEFEQGAPAARNLGMKYAKGEWLQFLDADDEILPGKLAKQLSVLVQNIDASVLIGSYRLMLLNGKEKIILVKKENPYLGLFFSDLGITSSNLWKYSSVERVGGWEKSYKACQEYELLSRLILAGNRLVFINEPDTVIHQRENSISYQSKSYYYYNFKFRKFWYDKMYQLPEYESSKSIMEKRFFNIIKMYSRVCPEKGIATFKAYFPKLYPVARPFEGGLFYLVAKFLGYRVAVWALRVLR